VNIQLRAARRSPGAWEATSRHGWGPRGESARRLSQHSVCKKPFSVAWRRVLLPARCFTRTVSLGWHHLASVSRFESGPSRCETLHLSEKFCPCIVTERDECRPGITQGRPRSQLTTAVRTSRSRIRILFRSAAYRWPCPCKRRKNRGRQLLGPGSARAP
jgi:hypothetical protein